MTDKKNIRKIIDTEGAKIYFIGIGGISMSSLAMMLKERGLRVFGSDIRKSKTTEALMRCGIRVKYSHSRAEIMSVMPDIVVYSLSVSEDNPEYLAAKKIGIPAVSRAELLGAIMVDYKISVGVSGSHGKSTSVGMMAKILEYQSLSPTVLLGAEISEGSGYIKGNRDCLVYEACEYGDSFLHFSPGIQILLNLDLDHTDYFPDTASLRKSFLRSANLASMACILNADSENLRAVIDDINVPCITFSRDAGYDFRYEIKGSERGRFSFDLYRADIFIGNFSLGVLGEFNVTNAVACVISADMLGVPRDVIRRALLDFSGLKRRLQLIKSNGNFDVFYDYAHHPCEIKAVRETLEKMGYKRICAVFSPHTYSRTKAFFEEFAAELSKFEKVFITDIFGAREKAITGVTSSALSEAVRIRGGCSECLGGRDITKCIYDNSLDALVLLGAGDLEPLKERIENL